MQKIFLQLLFCLCFSLPTEVFSQDSVKRSFSDSLFVSAKDSLLVKDTLSNRTTRFDADFPSLEELIRKGKTFSLLANEIRIELQDKLDTIRFHEEIPEMEETLRALENRVKTPNTKFNFRYILALERILGSIKENNQELDQLAQSRLDRLQYLDSTLRAIKRDDFFLYKLRDTTLLTAYSDEIQNLRINIHYLDSTIYQQELLAATYQAKLSRITIGLLELERYVDTNKTFLEKNLLKKEINYFWETYDIPSPKSILDITKESLSLNFFFLKRQLFLHPSLSIFSVLVLLIGYLALKRIVLKISKDKEFGAIILGRTNYLKNQVLATTMMAVLPLVFFLFDTGSIALLTFFIYLQVIFSTILIFSRFKLSSALKWLVLVFAFVFVSISNLYWEIAYQERMYFQISNLIYLFLLWQIPKKFESDDANEVLFLNKLKLLTMIFLISGFLANVLGRFSLAKILSVAGTVGFIYGVCMYFFVKAVMEIIYILLENRKGTDDLTSFLDFQAIQKRSRSLFLFLAVFFWLIIFLHNLALSDYVGELLTEILSTERSLGEATFTFGGILLFLGLVYASFIIANNLAYFISLKDQKKTDTRSKKLGSSVLLIRLGVLTVGFIIAATAAKIPLDKITIVLGALSVGIGFGLQTIINNLVSGVILAFERPIQIGDDIEVGTLTGKVKEVGIRASKIQAYDGSEIVVPNGELLSRSLINWTLSDKKRRIELLIGVSYDSDMNKVRELIEKVLDKEEILKYPAPRVLMQNFNESSVDFRILLWIESMDTMLDVRNKVMSDIFEAFNNNHIKIPYPQRDLYIKEVPKFNLEEKDSENDENKKSSE
ncbi:mechanosensitive ion channel family protein [Algoriphagus sp. AK58]|uniref:mechanosensitive ion channel family protein n=1 Tax=Algoriphagus sp. AK58 TaxID=1406877 RepID=UPI00164F2ED6|nr:mechanosensitive ion channel domain-containing protein [Algoriphagus sp. AK58]MBC6368706.1 mechanosensitive ion channel protein MscS [Algoriphagus sp. AK58]